MDIYVYWFYHDFIWYYELYLTCANICYRYNHFVVIFMRYGVVILTHAVPLLRSSLEVWAFTWEWVTSHDMASWWLAHVWSASHIHYQWYVIFRPTGPTKEHLFIKRHQGSVWQHWSFLNIGNDTLSLVVIEDDRWSWIQHHNDLYRNLVDLHSNLISFQGCHVEQVSLRIVPKHLYNIDMSWVLAVLGELLVFLKLRQFLYLKVWFLGWVGFYLHSFYSTLTNVFFNQALRNSLRAPRPAVFVRYVSTDI